MGGTKTKKFTQGIARLFCTWVCLLSMVAQVGFGPFVTIAYASDGSARYVWEQYDANPNDGGTHCGFVSSNNRNEYPNDGRSIEDGYWFVYQGSDSINPQKLEVSKTEVAAGESITVTITAGTNVHGGAIEYTLEQSTDGGKTWLEISENDTLIRSIAAPSDGVSKIVFRVRAIDNYGYKSPIWVKSATVSVTPPKDSWGDITNIPTPGEDDGPFYVPDDVGTEVTNPNDVMDDYDWYGDNRVYKIICANVQKGLTVTPDMSKVPVDIGAAQSVTYSIASGNEYASINEITGEITGTAVGIAVIDAVIIGADGVTYYARGTVTIEPRAIDFVTLKYNNTVNVDETVSPTLTISPASYDAYKSISYVITSGSSFANIEETTGIITGKLPGTVSIKVTIVDAMDNTHTATASITVMAPLKGISLNKTNTTINMGSTETLTVTYDPNYTTDDKTVTWTSSNPDVATVSNGKITPVYPGTTTITAKVGAFTATCTVTINAPLHGISLNKTSTTINMGDTETLTVTYDPSYTTDDKTITWTSSNTGVATVSGGKITPVAPGTTTITAKVGNFTATCTVTIKAPLKGISLNKTSTTINMGSTETLTVTYDPNNTTDDKTVIWTSSNTAVATVSGGKITPVAPGTTTITAKVGSFTATCEVTVYAPLQDISLNKTSTTINMGSTETLTVTYDPSNTTDDKTVTWTSSQTGVATVDSNGKITPVAPGSTTITAKVGNKTATCTVTVKAPLLGISLNKTSTEINVGDTETLTVTYNPSNTTDSKTVTWTSSNASVATVSGGKITAVAPGIVTITAKVGTKTATCTVTVYAPLQSINLNKTSTSLNVGGTETLTVTYNPSNTTDNKNVTWTTSDSSVVTVSDGKITAIAPGTATITAKVGTKTATCTVTVYAPLQSISLNKTSTSLNVGETETLTVTYNPSNTTDYKTVTWTSSNTSIATVSGGKITAVAPGTVTITAKVGTKTATCTVTVYAPLQGISLNKTSTTIYMGNTETLTVTYNPSNTTDDKTVVWTSSNTSVATVIGGKITPVAPGTTTITAKVGSHTATCTVTVKNNTITGLSVSGYSGTYDGNAHSITVTCPGATITYSESENGTYSSTNPSYTNAGTYTVYYKVEKSGYDTEIGSQTVVISKADGSLSISSTTVTVNEGDTVTFTVTRSGNGKITATSDDTSVATVSVSGTTVTVTGIKAGAVDVTVSVAAGTNHNAPSNATCVVTVKAPLQSISLNKTSTTLNVGGTETLTVTYNPSNTTDSKTVTWTSSDTNVATVSGGKITAVAPGTATITAKVGSKTATCTVTVKAPLQNISLNKTSTTLNVGATETLTVTYTPSNTTDSKTVTWTSDNTSVATVSGGKITAVAPGTATITATVGTKTATCTVTVKAPLQSISLNKTSTTINVGGTETLTVTYNPSNTTDSKTVTWTSSDTNVATVSGGKITAVAPGTATITATVGTKTATCTVTVKAPLQSISLNKTSATLNVGGTVTLTVTYNPSNTTDSKTVTWTSSDTAVATVNGGKITAVAPGTATITAKVGTKTATCTVTVYAPLQSISLNKTSTTINVGGTETLTVTYNPSNTTDSKTVTWTSSDTTVATVSGGKITAVAPGTATITATVGTKTATCTVTVKAPLQSISLNKTSTTLNVGDTETLTVTYNPSNTTDSKTVTWTSSNTAVATVSGGKITCLAPGTTTITATVGSKTATCTVTVYAPLLWIFLNTTSLSLEAGKTSTLIVNYSPTYTTDDKTVAWTSSNTAVATVSSSGVVTGVASGTTTITAKVGSCTASCTVTVQSVEVFAVLSTDGSLIFYNRLVSSLPTAGATYNGKTVTAAYSGFDTATYTAAASVPWYAKRTSIKTVSFADSISPVSTAYWFYGATALTTFTATNLSWTNVANAKSMFEGCSSLAGSIMIPSRTNSKLTTSTITKMFYGAATNSGCIVLLYGDDTEFVAEVVRTRSNPVVPPAAVSEIGGTPAVMMFSSLYGTEGATDGGSITTLSSSYEIESATDEETLMMLSSIYEETGNLNDYGIAVVESESTWDDVVPECTHENSYSGSDPLSETHHTNWWYCPDCRESDEGTAPHTWSTNTTTSVNVQQHLIRKVCSGCDYTYERYQDHVNVNGVCVICAEDLTVEINWDMQNATSSFAGSSIIAEQTVNTNLILPHIDQPKSGYIFMGWYTEKNGAGSRVNENTLFVGSESMTFYAYWVAEDSGVYMKMDSNTIDLSSIDTSIILRNDESFILDGDLNYEDLIHNRDVTWTSGNTSMLSVLLNMSGSNVMVRPLSTGTTTLTATITDADGTSYTKSINITVESKTPATLLPQNTWYKGSVNASTITYIGLLSHLEAIPAGYDESWDASLAQDGSIMCYRYGTGVIMVGNGAATIKANTDSSYMFSGTSAAKQFSSLQEIGNINVLDTSETTDMSYMFYYAGVKELDLSSFSTSNVTTIAYMFRYCSKLKKLDISSFDTSAVTTMKYAFYNCTALEEVTLGAKFARVGTYAVLPTPSNSYVFGATGSWYDAAGNTYTSDTIPDYTAATYYALNQSGVYALLYDDGSMVFQNGPAEDTSKTLVGRYTNFTDVVHTGTGTVPWYSKRTSIISVKFKDAISVASTSYWFYGATKLTSFDTTNLDTSSATSMAYMFYNCSSLTELDLSQLVTSNVTSMTYMFSGCTKLESLNVSTFDTTRVTTMAYIFNGCNYLKELDLSSFNTSAVTTMKNAFTATYRLQEITLGSGFAFVGTNGYLLAPDSDYIPGADGTNWYASDGTAYARTAIPANTADTYYAVNLWDVYALLYDDGTMVFTDGYDVDPDKTLSYAYTGFDTTTYTSYSSVPWYDQRASIVSIECPDYIKVTSTAYWFYGATNLTNVDKSSLRYLDIVDATSMAYMFYGCTSLESVDIWLPGFDGVSYNSVASMAYMFSGCTKLKTVILDMETPCLTSLAYMFNGCTVLEDVFLGTLDTSKVTTMAYMFNGCNYLKELDLFNFSTASVTTMQNMFRYTYRLQEVFLGASFAFVGTNGYLLAPSSSYIPGADGTNWYMADGTAYARNAIIPANSPGIYYAYNPKGTYAFLYDDGSMVFSDSYDPDPDKTLSNAYTGFVSTSYTSQSSVPWYAQRTSIVSVDFEDAISPTSLAYWFYGATKLTSFDTGSLDAANASSLAYMFQGCTSLTSIDLYSLYHTNTTTAAYMFSGCTALKTVDMDFGTFTDSMTNLSYMFNGCTNLQSVYFGNAYTEKVTTMAYMFAGCNYLTELDLSSFSTASATSTAYMFRYTYRLQVITLGADFRFVTTSGRLLSPSNSYITGADGNWYDADGNPYTIAQVATTHASNAVTETFYATAALASASSVATASAYSLMRSAVVGAPMMMMSMRAVVPPVLAEKATWYNSATAKTAITKIVFQTDAYTGSYDEQWDASAAGDSSVIAYIDGSTLIIAGNGAGSICTSADASGMFKDFSNVTEFVDLSILDTSGATNMSQMFYGCSSIDELDLSNFDTRGIVDSQYMSQFAAYCDELDIINLGENFGQIRYTVSYNGNGNTSGSMSDETHIGNTEFNLASNQYGRSDKLTLNYNGSGAASTVVNVDFTFTGWSNSANDDTVLYANGAYVSNLTDIAGGTVYLHAVWSSAGTTLPTPTRDGYVCIGWATTEGATIPEYACGDTYVTDGDETLYAVWKVNTYTVVFNRNGGSGTMENQNFTYDQAQNLTTNTFTRTGYTFLGWSTDKNATAATYTDGQSVINLTAEENGTVVLYAVWKAHTFTVKFDANTGEGTMADQTFTYDQYQNLRTNTFTKLGYTFLGWSTDKNATSATYTDNQSVHNLTPDANGTVTLYAVWSTNSYTVKFNANTGEGTMTDQTFKYDTAQNLKGNAFTKEGYTFLGWSTDKNATAATYQNKQSVINLTSTANGSVTLYAIWQANTFTVKFDGNGNTNTDVTMADMTFTYDKAQNLIANVFAKTGYTFLGWSTDKNATSATYADKASVDNLTAEANGTVTLYAVWGANSYSVVFNANGGTGTMNAQSFTYNKAQNLDTNTFNREGYVFLGWATSSDRANDAATTGIVDYTDGQSVKNLTTDANGIVNLYAVWRVENTVTITSQPTDVTVIYNTDATFQVTATGPVPANPAWELSYQWQFSKTGAEDSWSNISGATAANYTVVGGTLDAGTYYYRVVVTCTIPSYDGVFDSNKTVDMPSSAAKLTINKAPGFIEITDATNNVEMPSDRYLIYKIGTQEIVVANVSCNAGASVEVGVDGIWDAALVENYAPVKARIEDGRLIIKPSSEVLDGITVTVRTTESKNYEVVEWTVKVYVSAGAKFSDKVLNPDSITNTNVTASVSIVDPMTAVDSNYKVVSVKAYRLEDNGSETEIPVTKIGTNRYSFVIEENGFYELRATDTLGNTTLYGTDHNELYIDFIDKVAPVISNIGGVAYNSASSLVDVLLLAVDPQPGTPVSQLMYCWDYVEGSSSNVWTATCTNSFPLYTEIVVAVRDLAGNITSMEYEVDLAIFDGSGGGGGNNYISVLSKIYNDISGTIFGRNAYLQNGNLNNYSNGGYAFVFKVTPANTQNYIGGHMVFDYGVTSQSDITFPVTWYEDEACTIPIGTIGDDGSTILTNKVAYGKVILNPAQITNISTSARNASAILYLSQYEDTSIDGKVASEKYSMPCSVDVTAPSISASYDPYSREITLRVQDTLAGMTESVTYTISGGGSGTCTPYAVLDYPTDPNDKAAFTISFTAADVLGNTGTRSFTFSPEGIVGDDGSGSGDDESDGNSVNVYSYKTRNFKIHIINGPHNNSSIDSIGR